MHACDREILRLDLEQITRSRNIYNASTQFTIRLRLLIEQITRSRNIYNASTQFTIRLRLLIQNDSLFKRPNSQSLYSA